MSTPAAAALGASSLPSDAQPELEALHAALRQRLLQTGEWSRILDVLKRGLDESGWEAGVREVADAKAKEQTKLSLPELVAAVSDQAYETVPERVRNDVMEILLEFISRNVEDA